MCKGTKTYGTSSQIIPVQSVVNAVVIYNTFAHVMPLPAASANMSPGLPRAQQSASRAKTLRIASTRVQHRTLPAAKKAPTGANRGLCGTQPRSRGRRCLFACYHA